MPNPLPAALAAVLLASCTSPATGLAPAAVVGEPTVAVVKPRPKPASRAAHKHEQARRHLHVIAVARERNVWLSKYVGVKYLPRLESIRRCIIVRESEGQRVPAGYYQFTDPATRDYAARLMRRPQLVGIDARWWPRKMQDRAFFYLVDRDGLSPWSGGRWGCGF